MNNEELKQCGFTQTYYAKVTKSKKERQQEVENLHDRIVNELGQTPAGVDKEATILAKQKNEGIWIASDNGYYYFWNGSAYQKGGVYQGLGITNKSVNAEKLSDDILTKEEVNKIVEPELIRNGYYWFTTNEIAAGNWNYIKVNVENLKGQDVLITGTDSNDTYHYGITSVDASNQLIEQIHPVNIVNKNFFDFKYKIPSNAKYIYINFAKEIESKVGLKQKSLKIVVDEKDLTQGLQSKINEAKESSDYVKNNFRKNKSIIILNFDQATNIYTDGRYDMIYKEFGYPFTFACSYSEYDGSPHMSAPTPEQIREMVGNGCDYGIYNGLAPSGDPNDSSDWDTYVKQAVELAKTIGVYNPVCWMCAGSRFGSTLKAACIKYGFKMARGYTYGTAESTEYLIKSFSKEKFNTVSIGLYPNSKEAVFKALDEAITNGWSISVLTHAFYETDEEANAHYGCTPTIYREFLNKVKAYVDEGNAEVLTYREFYSRYYYNDGYQNDYSRLYKLLSNK